MKIRSIMYALKPLMQQILIPISDSFVHPNVKLTDGNGHGETRIYTGDNGLINKELTLKPWKIEFDEKYKDSLSNYFESKEKFKKSMENRVEHVEKNINLCEGKLIKFKEQNGKGDVRRFYIGIEDDENNKLNYKFLRNSLIAKEALFQITESEDEYICTIIDTKDVCVNKEKRKLCSNVGIECLKYKAREYNIEIQTEENGGEFSLRNPENGYFWPVDGYHECGKHKCNGNKDEPCPFNNNIWEFQGDYFHGNPLKYSGQDAFHNKKYEEKYEKDRKKKEFYESKGYKMNIIWESEWTNEKKLLKKQGVKWY